MRATSTSQNSASSWTLLIKVNLRLLNLSLLLLSGLTAMTREILWRLREWGTRFFKYSKLIYPDESDKEESQDSDENSDQSDEVETEDEDVVGLGVKIVDVDDESEISDLEI